jgi:hypothetical protein
MGCQSALRLPHDGITIHEAFGGDGAMIYKHACALGCEGIVSKRLGSPYRAGRSAHWLKIKNPASLPAPTLAMTIARSRVVLSRRQFHRPLGIRSAPAKPNVKREQQRECQTNREV